METSPRCALDGSRSGSAVQLESGPGSQLRVRVRVRVLVWVKVMG